MAATLETQLPEGWFDTWHKIAVTYDGENVKLFLDGKLEAEAPCVIPEGSFEAGTYDGWRKRTLRFRRVRF